MATSKPQLVHASYQNKIWTARLDQRFWSYWKHVKRRCRWCNDDLISNLELGLGLHCCLVHLDIVDSHPAEQGEGFNKVLVVGREGKLIKLQQLGFLTTFFTFKFIIEKSYDSFSAHYKKCSMGVQEKNIKLLQSCS